MSWPRHDLTHGSIKCFLLSRTRREMGYEKSRNDKNKRATVRMRNAVHMFGESIERMIENSCHMSPLSLTSSPMLIGIPTCFKASRPGGTTDASRIELLQSSHTRSRESILKLRDMRQILVLLNSTSLTCATMLSQHFCTCEGNTLPRSGATRRKRRQTFPLSSRIVTENMLAERNHTLSEFGASALRTLECHYPKGRITQRQKI